MATVGRAQATSLYNLFYYVGSSLIGWLSGFVFTYAGWSATALVVAGLALTAALLATATLRQPNARELSMNSGATGRQSIQSSNRIDRNR